MKTKETIRAELQAAAERMPRYATAYRGLEQKTFDTIYPLVMGYIRDRFLLTKEMCRSDRLLDLADISLRYMLDLKRMGIDPGEISRSCSGASSVITKKVLLMKAVQELFEVSMTPTEFASIETVTELTEFICRHHLSACNSECSDDKQKTEAEGFDVYAIRENFPALGESIHGQPLCYLDNAATAQMPTQALDAVRQLERCRANIHRGNDLAVVFQEPMTSLDPVMRIGPQVEESLRVHTRLSAAERRERALEALRQAELPDPEAVYRRYPHELSGGMLQRVMIAAAIISRPKLLLADEPTTALDVTIQAQILALLRKLNRENGMAILFISHNLQVVRKLCENVAVMQKGRLVESGNVEQIFRAPEHDYTRQLIAAIPTRDKKLI